jgi:hypothetical protein
MSIVKGVKGQIEGEELNEAGRYHPYLRILIEENLIRNGIHQDGALSVDGEFGLWHQGNDLTWEN